MRLAIFGGRGSGVQIADVARRMSGDIEIVGFLNDVEPEGSLIEGVPVIGPFDSWQSLDDDIVFSATLHNSADMGKRIERVEGLGIPQDRWFSAVDPTSIRLSGVTCGVNNFRSPYSILLPGGRIGNHVAVRHGATVGHDNVVGDHVFVGVNATLAGYVKVGRGTFIGIGAIVRERLTIGSMAIIGVGAVVIEDVPDGTVVAGNPARPIRQRRVTP